MSKIIQNKTKGRHQVFMTSLLHMSIRDTHLNRNKTIKLTTIKFAQFNSISKPVASASNNSMDQLANN